LVSVAFADGSTMPRHTSCTGNALARVASEVVEATIIEATHDETVEDETAGAHLTDIRDACEQVP